MQKAVSILPICKYQWRKPELRVCDRFEKSCRPLPEIPEKRSVLMAYENYFKASCADHAPEVNISRK